MTGLIIFNIFFKYIYKDFSNESYNTYAKSCNSIFNTKHPQRHLYRVNFRYYVFL